MIYPHLIILYGSFHETSYHKNQRHIEEKLTCGYRSYAEKFGEIVYLSPERIYKPWEKSICNQEQLHGYLKRNPDSIIWLVKHDKKGTRDEVVKEFKNKKVYYSCNSYNSIHNNCYISLVDIPSRLSGNGRLWVKGKDPDFWKPNDRIKKLYDYVFIGTRGDKNECWFIEKLTEAVENRRAVLWIGGANHKTKIPKTHHSVFCTSVSNPWQIVEYLQCCKVGVILSDLKAEGFPQSFLEMTMCGVPVCYMGPNSDIYFNKANMRHANKTNAVDVAESMLHDQKRGVFYLCSTYAKNVYSLEQSYQSILEWL